MSVLLQISDPHFGTQRPPVVEALIALAHSLEPEVIVMSGDITQRARRAQFAAARRFVDRLARPVVAIPGNHDIPLFNVAARAFAPYSNYERAFGRDLEPQWSSESLLVICVNTTRPARHKDGEVSGSQIERVASRLRGADPRQLRIVVTHQPVHVIREHDLENLLHGHEAAVRAWADAGADIIMGGHIHLPYVCKLKERHALRRRMWAVQAGTAVSHRIRECIPNSVNVVRYSSGQRTCAIERWDYDMHTARFAREQVEELALERESPAS